MAKTPWSIAGEEIASCNCAWGCPCQFNALPTTGRCEAFVAWRIDKGHFGDTCGGGREHRGLLGELRGRLLRSGQYLRPTQSI